MKTRCACILGVLVSISAFAQQQTPSLSDQEFISSVLKSFRDISVGEARTVIQTLNANPGKGGKAAIVLRDHLETIFRLFHNLQVAREAGNNPTYQRFLVKSLDPKIKDADAFSLASLSPENQGELAFVLNAVSAKAGMSWRSASPESQARRDAEKKAREEQEKFRQAYERRQREIRAEKTEEPSAWSLTFRVQQVMKNGFLARVWGDLKFVQGLNTANLADSLVFVHGINTETLVDNALIQVPVVEDGRFQYVTVLGSVSTVRRFKAIGSQ